MPTQAKALKLIAGVSAEQFRLLARKLVKQSNPSIRATGLLKVVKELSGNDEFAVALCTQLISLATFRRVEKMDLRELLDGLFEGMEVAEFPDETIKWYNEVRSDFASLLDCDSVRLPAKALHLSTDFEQLYASANVITDVRAVCMNWESWGIPTRADL